MKDNVVDNKIENNKLRRIYRKVGENLVTFISGFGPYGLHVRTDVRKTNYFCVVMWV